MNYSSLGMTGNRLGFQSKFQQRGAWSLFKFFEPKEFHHGGCIGCDDQCHSIALTLNIPIIVHRPINESEMASCTGGEDRLAKTYLARNRDIVAESDVMLSFPRAEWNPNDRGGTVWTTKYTIKLGIPIVIVTPTQLHWHHFPEGIRQNFFAKQILRANEEGSTKG